MLSRSTGVIWIMVGLCCTALSTTWMVLEQKLLGALPSDLLLLLGFLGKLVAIPVPPPYGAQVTFFVGAAMIFLGGRLILGLPGTRIIAAYLHAVAGICLLALTYLLFTATILWPLPNVRYIVCGLLGVFAFSLWGSAVALYQRLADSAAASWKPFEQCPQCGRKINAPQQCPIHNLKLPYPRLINEARRKVYHIPLSPTNPTKVGRDYNADVWFDEADDQAYLTIARAHAEITADAQNFFITHVAANSQTTVAEIALELNRPVPLPLDAIVKLGGVPFKFQVKYWYQAEIDSKPEDVRYALD